MEPKRRKHYRIAVKEIHAAPENGIYITKNEAQKFCIFGTVVFIFLAILAAFPRKK
ncbi:MAG: hypothetical protein PHG19_04985 [Anaerotignum sp.]|nr:hypothetical protein [Anaerotignum sp.]